MYRRVIAGIGLCVVLCASVASRDASAQVALIPVQGTLLDS